MMDIGNSDKEDSVVTTFFENSPETLDNGCSSEEDEKDVGHARTDNYDDDDSDF